MDTLSALAVVNDILGQIAGMLQQHTALFATVNAHGEIVLKTSRNGATVKVLGTPEQAVAAANAAFLRAGTRTYGHNGN